MKIILGLNAFHADTSACIIKDDKLEVAIEEERITRIKHCANFPIESIKECLKITGLNFKDITDVSINSDPKKNLQIKLLHFIKNFQFKKINYLFFNRIKNKINLKNLLADSFELKPNLKINNIEHHLSHLSSSFYSSGFEKAVGLTIDGSGDFTSLLIADCSLDNIIVKKRIYFPNSLGIFYQGLTQLAGFKNYGDEYKLMGLAPYGHPEFLNELKNILFKNSDSLFSLNLNNYNHHKLDFKYDISEKIKVDNLLNNDFENNFNLYKKKIDNCFQKNLAASTQKIYEEYYVKILNFIKRLNISKNIVFSGGCALNSSANNILLNDNYFNKIFIPYAPADNGGSIGAALYTARKEKGLIRNTISPYLGNEYENNHLEKILDFYKKNYKIKIDYFNNFDDLCNFAINEIIKSCVIGWFQGKMEFGPRALGNRSILADPRNQNIKEIINKKIKKRENFRPFAPSILSEHQKDWFEEKFENIYMSSVMKAKENKKKLIPSVVHIDGTSRVQTVKKEYNEKFYNLINKFYIKTKVPILLNTSFNENEPIVRSPEDAINCLLRTNIDSLYINNFRLQKIT